MRSKDDTNPDPAWQPQIANDPQRWTGDRFLVWRDLIPEKLELLDGRIGDQDELRFMVSGLLEQIGADEAVRIGDPEVWKHAVSKLP